MFSSLFTGMKMHEDKMRAQRETDEALAKERATHAAAKAADEAKRQDVLQLAGLQPHAAYLIEKKAEEHRTVMYPWDAYGLTTDLAKACEFADLEGFRVTLRKAYRLNDGTLALSPKLWRVREI